MFQNVPRTWNRNEILFLEEAGGRTYGWAMGAIEPAIRKIIPLPAGDFILFRPDKNFFRT